VDRSFKVQPPLCVKARQVFRFTCTPDPARAGYCKQTYADLGLSSVEKIADDRTCLKLLDEWIAGERAARE
jgi:hypothetical protein